MAQTPPRKPDVTRPIPAAGAGARPRTTEVTRPSLTEPTQIIGPSEKTNPILKPEALVTEGMQARKREMARRKRDAELKRLKEEEERAERWIRIRRWLSALAVIVIGGSTYIQLQTAYGNRWPLMAVWVAVSIAVLGCFGLLFWYLDSGE